MSEISRVIDSVVGALHPLMKQAGYKKRARNFRKPCEGGTQVVNLQASWGNMGDRGTFTLNLGLYFPAVAVIFNEGYEPSSSPSEAECHLRARIGALMPRSYDHCGT